MMSWLQFWRNTFYGIFDIEHLRNGKRYRHNSITVAIYSTKAIIWCLISINERKESFLKISRKVVRRWKRLDEQNPDHYSKWSWSLFLNENISSSFWDIVGNVRSKSLIQYAQQASIMTWWLQLWRNIFLRILTSNITGSERDTDIILSLLQSTRQRVSSGLLFEYLQEIFFLRRYYE